MMEAIGRNSRNILPDSVSSQDAIPPEPTHPIAVRPQPTHPISPGSTSTAVDGLGMWRSWTRVFAKPESACLDLLDNCFDAALKQGFKGRVAMESHGQSTISIQNNSRTPIKPLEAALTVFKSSKNFELQQDDHKDAIGENGVGLKQGCATLSDCSVVITRNIGTIEIGFIAKDLQSSQGVYLPSFTFDAPNVTADMQGAVKKWLANNPKVYNVLLRTFGPSVDVSNHITQFMQKLWTNQWQKEDHVFLLVLFNLKKSSEVPHALIASVCPAKAFLCDIKTMLPEQYINLPSVGMFEFTIDQEHVNFTYWQHRLVELTKFEVNIPTNEPFESLPESDWDHPAPGKYKVNIYCGFDAQRMHQDLQLKQGTSTGALYIYSCQAGRLIKKENDARYMLGLGASGVDYCQGLTILVNDVAGKLPLTPTKDGIAWSEQSNGEIHQRNLLSWTGAIAQFYWTHHKSKFGGKGGNKVKETMKKTISSFAAEDQAATAIATKSMEDAQFTMFEGIKWKRIQANFDYRWKIRKSYQNIISLKGPDTLFIFTSDRIQRIKDGRKPKRKAVTTLEGPNKRGSIVKNANIPWSDIKQEDISRVTVGVLAYLRDKDKEKVFENPVIESVPQIEEKYLQVVSEPMDFRTIEQERMNSYTSIKELQNDLIRTFSNCILFNGIASKYGKMADQMLDWLDEAFESQDVKQVTMGVLAYLRDLDEKELFEIPVVEQLPEMKHDYLNVVSKPMDFRTIEEERMQNYTSIAELREDLILVFQNCIDFNGEWSPFGGIAQKMLERLDDAFESVTMGKRKRKSRVKYNEIVNQYNGVEAEEEATSKRSNVKKKIPYNALAKQLRDTEKQLQAERALVKELKKQLADRDDRIRRLKGGHTKAKRGPKRPRREEVSTPRGASTCTSVFESLPLPNSRSSLSDGANPGCSVCGKDDDYERLMICEGCSDECHIYCLTPPLYTVPVDDWYCSRCLEELSLKTNRKTPGHSGRSTRRPQEVISSGGLPNAEPRSHVARMPPRPPSPSPEAVRSTAILQSTQNIISGSKLQPVVLCECSDSDERFV